MDRRSGGDQERDEETKTVGRRLRRLRMQSGWSQPVLAYHFLAVAATYRRAVEKDSLVKMISKWEGDRIVPDQFNRRVLAEVLGVTVADLGLDVDPDFVLQRRSQLDRNAAVRH